ncbi:MAG: phospho-sugar mutase, partial [Clostridia bacterium]|nr:phospho-sugar mutase [Clostridia bacterium]
MTANDRYISWLENAHLDADARKELEAIKGDDKQIEDRFYKDLEFGTGGLRGVLGMGTNRMNVYTVRRAAAGLGKQLIHEYEDAKEKGVAIAHDSRIMSKEFALDSALALAALGIRVYLFESLRPTPELSFAIKHLKTVSGIVITASHNPAEYNGFKAYGPDGGQITLKTADAVFKTMTGICPFEVEL